MEYGGLDLHQILWNIFGKTLAQIDSPPEVKINFRPKV